MSLNVFLVHANALCKEGTDECLCCLCIDVTVQVLYAIYTPINLESRNNEMKTNLPARVSLLVTHDKSLIDRIRCVLIIPWVESDTRPETAIRVRSRKLRLRRVINMHFPNTHQHLLLTSLKIKGRFVSSWHSTYSCVLSAIPS